MVRLLVLLLLALPAWAAPLRVDGLRIESPLPLDWTRARVEGTRLVWDVAWSGAVDATDMQVTRPQPGVVRLSRTVPPGRVASVVRTADGRILRLNLSTRPPLPQGKRVTRDFESTNLVYVLKVLAKERGYYIYIGPGVEEPQVAVVLRCAPPRAGSGLVPDGVGGQCFYVAPPKLLASSPDRCPYTPPPPGPIADSVRQEIILEYAPAAKVADFLQGQYKNVRFTLHPTLNGFDVYGSRKDILQIKAEVPNLDRTPEPPVTRSFPLRNSVPDETKALLATLVPDVDYKLEGRNLVVTGPPRALDQVSELVYEIERPIESGFVPPRLLVDCKLIELDPRTRQQLGIPASAEHCLIPLQRLAGLKVLAAPRADGWLGRELELFIGDSGRRGFRLTASVREIDAGRLNLEVIVELPDLPLRREYSFEVKDGDLLALPDVIPAADLEAIRQRPDGEILGPLVRAVTPGRGLTLLLYPHIMR